MKRITLRTDCLKKIRMVDERMVSYNIEMAEVTGGTFWKAYTDSQIAGKENFNFTAKDLTDFTALAELMQVYPPIDLYNERLRAPKQSNWALLGFEFPALGQRRPITILTASQTDIPPTDTKAF